jgi:Na+:H+ antiporter, NhaA family
MIGKNIRNFLKLESAGGILLIFASILAIICANSPFEPYYNKLLTITGELRIEDFSVSKPALLWINDLWMAVFFLMVGLELKRELVEGELADRKQVIVPAAAALGGMVIPALFYVYFNHSNEIAMNGWAIPAATDIAFALGVLAILGTRVPVSLKVLLVSIAIIDDIGAIIIIALFYSGSLSQISLVISAICIVILFILNRRGVADIPAYIFVGLILWTAVLKSGVHATLAGVILGFFIPLKDPQRPDYSPAKHLEHSLHPIVAFVILPVFAFANAGVPLSGISIASLTESVPLGITTGLFIGKPLGVFLGAWLVVKFGLAKLPEDIDWKIFHGVGILCGIGFTMSLFIGGLAFEQSGGGNIIQDRIGILTGSLLSGIVGYFYLRHVLPERAKNL